MWVKNFFPDKISITFGANETSPLFGVGIKASNKLPTQKHLSGLFLFLTLIG